MKISIFWIGVIISVIGITWISMIYVNSNKEYSEFLLAPRESQPQELHMTGKDVGYYKISVPNLDDNTFVQIIDPYGNIIEDKKIETKMSVNYFDIKDSGLYTIKITNVSDHQFTIGSEFGNTNSGMMLNPGIVILCGMIVVVCGAFKRLQNYKIAQPDESSS